MRSRKKTIIFILVLVVIAGAASLFIISNKHSTSNVGQNTTNAVGEEKLDLSPASESDKQQAEVTKNDIVKRDEQAAQQNTATIKTVSPTITDAGQYDQNVEVRAFISGIFEDGGTCTFTFTKGSQKITKTTSGVKDATTTRCSNLTTPKSEFSTGTWNIVVSYSSSVASGSSSAKTFEVQ